MRKRNDDRKVGGRAKGMVVKDEQREKPDCAELDLLDRALGALARSTGFEFKSKAGSARRGDPDGYILVPGTGAREESWPVEIKKYVSQAALAHVIEQMRRSGASVLVTEYVNPRLADRLRLLDVPFIDTAGNAYLKFQPFFVFVRDMKPERKPAKAERPRPFRTAGLKIIFALLSKPELVNETYRGIAAVARVALGSVAVVMDNLEKLAFIQGTGDQRQLSRREEILRRWVTAYSELLRPKLVIGEFATEEFAEWKMIDVGDAYWGGEVAAAKLVGHLRPEIMTLFVRERRQAAGLQLKLKLRKTSNPNAELLQAFWDPQLDPPEPNLAPPLLVYADLVASADPRNLETARILYEKRLEGLVRED
ncbi:MAG: type IV toxin-antitoxin system AbiEi family antitoxin [Acidobacteriota bacterium]